MTPADPADPAESPAAVNTSVPAARHRAGAVSAPPDHRGPPPGPRPDGAPATPSAAGAVVLCLDIGSTGVRAARLTGRGDPAGPVSERRYRTAAHAATGRPDPAVVLTAVVDLLDAVDWSEVQAVCTAVQWQTVLAVDAADGPLAPAFTWESTVPPADLAETRHLLSDSWSRLDSGTYLHASSPVAAITALRLPKAARLTDLAGWVIRRVTGRDVGWSPVVAAASGLWHQRAGDWHSRVLTDLDVDVDRLGGTWNDPVLPRPGSPAAGWAPAATWLPPLGDGLCHNLGLGCVGPDRTVLTVGTSGSVRAVLGGHPVVPDGLWSFAVGERTSAVGGAVTSAGNVLEWVTALTSRPIRWGTLTDPVPSLPGLRVSPDVFGRRGPDYPDDALGAVRGLGPGSTLDDLVAAFVVDTWRSFAVLQTLLDTVTGPGPVTAAGGVLEHHPVVAQLLADALDRPVRLVDVPQPALRGAALVARQALLDPSAGVRAWVDRAADELAADAPGEVLPPGHHRSGHDDRGAHGDRADAHPADGPTVTRLLHPRPAWARALRERWASPG